MANTQIDVISNGTITLATAGKYCDRNIDINVNVQDTYIVLDYWKSYLATKADEINAALEVAGENRSAFLWYTDAHWKTNYGQSPMILRYLSRHTGMTKTYFGGDVAVEASGETELLTAWLESVSCIPNHRSMIGNHDNNYNADFPTAAERAEFFLRTNRTADMAFGSDSTNGKMYYYVDDYIEQTRYIVLSTGRMWTYADEVQWCVDTLLSTPSGWHIVVAAHLWLDNDYDASPVVPLETPERYTQVFLDLFDAYNYRESGTTEFASTAYDFANGKAKVEFIIGGHVHQDYDFATSKGIPVILTECDAWQERDSVSVATNGTTTENCVYAIVADYAAKQVKVINVGRGDTRSLAIPDINLITYTNLLPTAIGFDGAVLDGKGYRDGARMSTSSNAYSSVTGYDCTGMIEAKQGDVIRVQNAIFKADTADYPRVSFRKANYDNLIFTKLKDTNVSELNPVYDADNNIVQFTVPSWPTLAEIKYIILCGQDFNAETIITVNEEIG